jgi:hypothetical protein
LRSFKTWNTRFSGKLCGHEGKDGYLRIGIKGKLFWAHRLAWLYEFGHLPVSEVDHINHIKNDNRIVNLRDCSKIENNKNMPMQNRNTSGVTGVHWCKSNNKWRSQIKVNRKNIYLGYFLSIELAEKSREAALKVYGFHENHGQ